ncbi:NADH-dependent flavin oxidoreductase [Paenibacillus cineris]|uniref:NADH-dependent flavin oxidoreductase YqiG n=1 Tax=Paenibacillus cineris TaxID=237530 RepID=A0ABQ4LBK4_9BACL|nr:NADH-dependent flavin oxidoreductase [Paenibacillus cineris]GIO53947.1 putative NADH-dependent flavin oxidoreductase YqiG [Paenibacillus cineris]
MKKSYSPLFDPFHFPSANISLKNRIVMSPMTHMSSNADGSISEQEIQYYNRRSHGAAMVITAATYVMQQGGMPGAPGADNDALIPGLRRLASTIQGNGAKAVLQIFHAGRQGSKTGDYVSAGNIPEDREGAPVPRSLSEQEMEGIIHAYAEAARRAVDAGFDGVEIHGGNGNLLHQFLSPMTNRRTDRYGGSLENRMTLALAIIREVLRTVRKESEQPFLVGFRFSPEEAGTPGITMADTLSFVDALSGTGVDYLHVSLTSFRSVPRRGIQDSRSRLAILQERVGSRIPIIGVGSIYTPDDALEALSSGIPLIALGRELIMEPDWVQFVLEGREQQIRTSISPLDLQELSIPEPLWNLMMSIPGWFPLRSDPQVADAER